MEPGHTADHRARVVARGAQGGDFVVDEGGVTWFRWRGRYPPVRILSKQLLAKVYKHLLISSVISKRALQETRWQPHVLWGSRPFPDSLQFFSTKTLLRNSAIRLKGSRRREGAAAVFSAYCSPAHTLRQSVCAAGALRGRKTVVDRGIIRRSAGDTWSNVANLCTKKDEGNDSLALNMIASC